MPFEQGACLAKFFDYLIFIHGYPLKN